MEPKFNPQSIKLIIGLGNPGKEYTETYHNAGALCIQTITEKTKQPVEFKKIPRKPGVWARIGNIYIAKPEVFMNESGKSVRDISKFLAIKPGEMVIAHDDNDIPIGSYKIDFNRGAAGHKGVASVIESMKTKEFWRIRIGIEKKIGTKRKRAEEFVLSRLSPKDKKLIQEACEKVAKELLVL